jgi:flagellar basal body P-ring formation protein FlgA
MRVLFSDLRIRRRAMLLALGLLFLAGSAALVFSAEDDLSEPLRLRARIESQDANLRFGDVFSNAGKLSDIVLTRSPAPGRTVSLDPAWLSAKAARYKRVWRNASSVKRVTVRRAGRQIGTGILRTLIAKELEAKADGVRYEIALSNRSQILFAPLDAKGEARVLSFDMSPQSGAFSARILPYDEGVEAVVRGRAWRVVSVPALSRSLGVGEAINPQDIQWIDVREASLRPGTLMDPQDIDGKASRRPLRAGKPLRATDFKRLAAVNRGEIITITYRVPGIRLTAKARALTEAALGEPLRVVNLQSSRTIDVVVTAPGQARANFGPVVGG